MTHNNPRTIASIEEALGALERRVSSQRERTARVCLDSVMAYRRDCGCADQIAEKIRDQFGIEEEKP